MGESGDPKGNQPVRENQTRLIQLELRLLRRC